MTVAINNSLILQVLHIRYPIGLYARPMIALLWSITQPYRSVLFIKHSQWNRFTLTNAQLLPDHHPITYIHGLSSDRRTIPLTSHGIAAVSGYYCRRIGYYGVIICNVPSTNHPCNLI